MRGSVPPTMRIGELAAKVGVSTHVLRAWESRYGLLRPVRSAGGYRLYGHEDERRVREVIALRDQGVSAAEASRRVLATERGGTGHDDRASDEPVATPAGGRERRPRRCAGGTAIRVRARRARRPRAARRPADARRPAARRRDGARRGPRPRRARHRVRRALDRERHHRRAAAAVRAGRRDVGARPHRHRPGALREQPGAPPARGALAHLGVGTGPVAVLACPPGEFHDIVLLSFGVLLGRAGWRIRYLGPDTPIHSLAAAARLTQADAVVLACRRPVRVPGPRVGAPPAQRGPPGVDRRPGCDPAGARGGRCAATSAVTSSRPSPSSPPRPERDGPRARGPEARR